MKMSILKKLFPKSYNLPGIQKVGKVSLGKFILEKFHILAAPNSLSIIKKKCLYVFQKQ